MVGVFNKSTHNLTLRHAPLYVVRHQVKALKTLEPILESEHDYRRARNVLGEAFGTKKAKAAIRAAEMNKVDVAAMKDVCASASSLFSHSDHPSQVADTLQSTIQSKMATLPKVEETKAEADSKRPIPSFNADATSPSEVGSNVTFHHSILNK
jgi:DNA-directed RNA polymerase I subunit RPA49